MEIQLLTWMLAHRGNQMTEEHYAMKIQQSNMSL